MSCNISFDVIIVGGGIAGLWTLASLRQRGYNAILLEQDKLGGGQSMASQGIIHGGSKYALAGIISQATNNISQMPHVWQQALNGQGDVDLSDVKILSDAQYLVPASGIDSKLLSFLGSKSMASFTETVKAKNLPEPYKQAGIQRNSFRLNEMVLDTQSIFTSFAKRFADYLYQANVTHSMIKTDEAGVTITLPNCQLSAKYLVLAAGNGNADISAAAMQQRPLQMVMLQDTQLPAIYAHFIGRSNKPLLTITSHANEHDTVWYMGGNLAEDGVNLSPEQQIQITQQLLKKLLPDLALSQQAQFSTLFINRAEPKQSSLLRPDDAHVEQHGRIITGWPTKLALAPRFAEKVLTCVTAAPSEANAFIAPPLTKAVVADFPWRRHA